MPLRWPAWALPLLPLLPPLINTRPAFGGVTQAQIDAARSDYDAAQKRLMRFLMRSLACRQA